MTMIDGRQFRCPQCGGDTIRESAEAWVSCDIVRFELFDDGTPYPDEETASEIDEITGEAQYQCAACGLEIVLADLPKMVKGRRRAIGHGRRADRDEVA